MKTAIHRSLFRTAITLGELAAMLLFSIVMVAAIFGVGLAIEAVVERVAEGVAEQLITER